MGSGEPVIAHFYVRRISMRRTRKVKKKSQIQESKTADLLGGRTQIASGAIWSMKADVRTDDYLVENKFTDEDHYSLTRATWEKIEHEAINDSLRTPMMQIDIREQQVVVIDKNLWEVLSKGYSNLNIIANVSTTKKSYRITEVIAEKLNIPTTCLNYSKLTFANNGMREKTLVILSLKNFLGLIE